MKAVGLTKYLAMELPESLQDYEIPMPVLGPRDILVAVEAVAVNPLDNRVRKPKDRIESAPRILGWDVAGIVVDVGSSVSRFKRGEKVFYAGDLNRPGGYSQYHAVDERVVARMPETLGFESAAGIPLTALTAWEALFDRLGVATVQPGSHERKTILIIGAAGGVGSMAVQLAARHAGLRVIATASRPESEAWVRELGATDVINHFGDIPGQVDALGVGPIDYVLILSDTSKYFEVAAQVVAPQGRICTAVEASAPVDLNVLWDKSITFVWEMVFTRTDFQTKDLDQHGQILSKVADLIDSGILRTTVSRVLSPINGANLHEALTMLQTGRVTGKIVLSGFA